MLVAICGASCFAVDDTAEITRKVEQELPLMGQRNWIVIADAAYPWHSRAGVETVLTNADHLSVLRAVLKTIGRTKHVRPNVYTTTELPIISDADAAGIKAYRDELTKALEKRIITALPQEELFTTVAKASESVRVLVIKTKMTLPYTSVFLQLDSAYWSDDAERKLREGLKPAK